MPDGRVKMSRPNYPRDSAMLNQLIEKLINDCDGAVAGFVMSFDGIPVELHALDEDAPARAAGMEFAFVMTQVCKAAAILKVGTLDEVLICCEKYTFLLRVLGEKYFAGVILNPDGNLGKGRFLLRMGAADLLNAVGDH